MPPSFRPRAKSEARVASSPIFWLAAAFLLGAGLFLTASLQAEPPRQSVSPAAVHAGVSASAPAESASAPAPPAAALLIRELEAAAQRERNLRDALQKQARELHDLRAQNVHLQTEVLTLTERQRVSRSQMLVAESTLEHLTTDLALAQQEIAKLRQSVAFYERLIPDGAPTGRVSIRSAELHTLGDGLMQYRVLVMRHGPAAERFQGELQFVATGKQDGGSATIPLERLANLPTAENTPGSTAVRPAPGLSFRQYQRASGLLAIPPGFTPVTITVRVLEGKAIRAEHTITLAKESLS